MTVHLPSRRLLIAAGWLTLAVVVLVVFWHAVISFVLAATGIAVVWRYLRRHLRGARRSPRWMLAFSAVSGARSARRLALAHSGELHAARIETERARAAELRSRVEHRRRTREEQEKAERAAYIRGAADSEGLTRP